MPDGVGTRNDVVPLIEGLDHDDRRAGFRESKAIVNACAKKQLPALVRLRFEQLAEGRAVQTLHIGAYDDEGPILQRLHYVFLPAQRLAPSGP